MKFLNAFWNRSTFIQLLLAIAIFLVGFFLLKEYIVKYTKHGESIEVPDISKMKLFDALVLIEQSGLKYEIDSFRYDDKFEPYTIFDVYPKMGSQVKEGRRIFIRANPRTWAPVEVPNLKDQYKTNAFRRLEQLHLTMGDTIMEPSKYKGAVLRMMYKGRNIEPGELVPRFSKIDLVIGSGLETSVSMINVLGLPLKDAENELKRNLFELGRVDDSNASDRGQAVVFYQFPMPGEIYDQGESVMLWVSDLPAEELKEEITNLDNIYNKKIKTDSTGNINYDYQQTMGSDVSSDVRKQIGTNIDNTTSRGNKEEKKKNNSKPESQQAKPNNSSTENRGQVIESVD